MNDSQQCGTWKKVDPEIGKRIEEAVYAGQANAVAPHDTSAEGVIA